MLIRTRGPHLTCLELTIPLSFDTDEETNRMCYTVSHTVSGFQPLTKLR